MKFLILMSLVAVGSCSLQAVISLLGGEENCDSECSDRIALCSHSIFKSKCNSPGLIGYFFKSWCSRSCGICRPCTEIAPRICNTQNDTCVDKNALCPRFFAPRFCHDNDWSGYVRGLCPKSCHVCSPCSLPVPIKSCDKDCKDEGDHCTYWKGEGHCGHYSIHYQYMSEKCQKSCGICKPCGLPVVHKSPAYLPATRKPSPATQKPVATRRPAATRPPVATRRPETKRPDNILKTCEKPEIYGVSQAQQCLNAHNYYRCLHGVEKLQYDSSLQRSAQLYANKLASIGYLKSSTVGLDRGSNVGENLAMKNVQNNAYSLNQAVTEWYAEGMFYDYNSEQATSETAQFTQLIWKETTRVGCAIRKVGNNFYAVAHYQVKGNQPGFFMDNIPMAHEGRCDTMCLDGACQGEQGNSASSKCQCNDRSKDYEPPRCGGPCVVICPRPRDHVGDWETTCDGSAVCTCNNKGKPEAGIIPGAICR